MIIKILGTGCPKCKLLQKTVEDAIKELSINTKVIKINTVEEIMQYDIMSMPALVIDEKIILTGTVPTPKEMLDILSHQRLSKDFIKWCGCTCK